MRKLYCVILINLFFSSFCFSQNWELINTSNSNIPFNSVRSLSIDSRGWLWISNNQKGSFPHIGWYDGSAWNSYLSTYTVSDIASDKKGDVYFSTSGKEILRYHFGSWFTQGSVLLSSSDIYPLHCDYNNVLWMGKASTYYALVKYDGKNWSEFNSLKSGVPGSPVSCIQSTENSLWIGTKSSGLLKLRDTLFTIFNTTNSILPSLEISALAVRNDSVYFVSGNKLMMYGNQMTVITEIPEEAKVYDMAIDSKGNFWFTSDKGLLTFNKYTWRTFNSSNSPIGNAELTSIIIDQNNNIFTGTEEHGIIKYNDNRNSNIEKKNDVIRLSFYPVPLSDFLNIDLLLPCPASDVTVEILDVNGKTLLHEKNTFSFVKDLHFSLKLPVLLPGSYFLRIITPNSSKTVKLMK